MPSRSLSRAPSLGLAYEHVETYGFSTVLDQEIEFEEFEAEDQDQGVESDVVSEEGMTKRNNRPRLYSTQQHSVSFATA
ncbi:hypothetical protein GYMLUDRAFT_35152 [Collybiopsis luxurians FD-317 M1]|nr:hypothetical protein GYMLUDRAFT_35152 [Collybiopsis luxurians FD-317 M1]